MHTYHVRLESPVATSFRCICAADSLDIDATKKSVHDFRVAADLDTPWQLGVVVGASGSGKTTLARSIWGDDALYEVLDLSRPVIDQFPDDWSYDQCAAALVGVGLTAVPCWIRPAATLSNGQRARAEAALQMSASSGLVALDEWTSVVDRTVAKVMSHCIQKFARRHDGLRVVLLSCHYDVLDWLNPDWVIDCNIQRYTDRRDLWRGFQRTDRLHFEVRAADRRSWSLFAKYHYLSDALPKGEVHCYGLFAGDDQIGFTCYANYVPPVQGKRRIMHENRRVIHPDFAGLGLGQRLANICAAQMTRKGFRVMTKFSSTPVFRAMSKDPRWRLRATACQIGRTPHGARLQRGTASFREQVRTYSFEFLGGDDEGDQSPASAT